MYIKRLQRGVTAINEASFVIGLIGQSKSHILIINNSSPSTTKHTAFILISDKYFPDFLRRPVKNEEGKPVSLMESREALAWTDGRVPKITKQLSEKANSFPYKAFESVSLTFSPWYQGEQLVRIEFVYEGVFRDSLDEAYSLRLIEYILDLTLVTA